MTPIDDSSMEFDLFEDVRCKLAEVMVREGYQPLEAERISLYVIQGVRGVPKLLSALTESVPHPRTLDLLHNVLNNAAALNKAKNILMRLEADDVN